MSVAGYKKNVLILSANIGMGHNQVSHALRNRLQKECSGFNVVVCDLFDYIHPFFKHLVYFGYQQSLRRFRQGYQWYYEATRNLRSDSKIQNILQTVDCRSLLETIAELSPCIVVSTFPYASGVISRLKANGDMHVPLVTVITDVTVHSQWIHRYVDAYLVAAETVASGLVKKGIARECIHVTGIPLREEFTYRCASAQSWGKYQLDPRLFTLMIMGGGKGLISGISDICIQLNKKAPPMQIVVAAGSNRTLGDNLTALAKTSTIPIRVFDYVENIAELMEISNLLLTKGGGVTVFEALAKGLPMLLYQSLPGHEAGNVQFLLKEKAAIIAQDASSAAAQIRSAVGNPAILEALKASMQTIARPFAAQEAAKIILGLAESGPKGIVKQKKVILKITLPWAK